jgi:hypothetical protein
MNPCYLSTLYKEVTGNNLKTVLKVVKSKKGTIFGTFSAKPQMSNSAWRQSRGGKQPGDSDFTFEHYSEKQVEDIAKDITERLLQQGANVKRVGGLIQIKKGNEWFNAVDLHAATPGPAGAYGVPFSGKTTTIEKMKAQTIGEQATRKFSSTFEIRAVPGEASKLQFAPEPGRFKDIGDYFATAGYVITKKYGANSQMLKDFLKLQNSYPAALATPGKVSFNLGGQTSNVPSTFYSTTAKTGSASLSSGSFNPSTETSASPSSTMNTMLSPVKSVLPSPTMSASPTPFASPAGGVIANILSNPSVVKYSSTTTKPLARPSKNVVAKTKSIATTNIKSVLPSPSKSSSASKFPFLKQGEWGSSAPWLEASGSYVFPVYSPRPSSSPSYSKYSPSTSPSPSVYSPSASPSASSPSASPSKSPSPYVSDPSPSPYSSPSPSSPSYQYSYYSSPSPSPSPSPSIFRADLPWAFGFPTGYLRRGNKKLTRGANLIEWTVSNKINDYAGNWAKNRKDIKDLI